MLKIKDNDRLMFNFSNTNENSENIDTLYSEANNLLQNDKFEEALQIAKKAYSIAKTDKTCSLLGSIYIELHQPEIALQYIDEALNLSPNEFSYHHIRSVALISLSRFDEAINSGEKMIDTFTPMDASDEKILPPFLFHDSLDLHKKIFSEHHRGEALIALIKKNYQESFKNIGAGLSLNPKDKLLLLLKGYLLLHQRRNKEALEYFFKSEEQGLTISEVYRGIGFAHLYEGNLDFAIQYLEKAFEQDKADLTTAIALHDAYILSENFYKLDKHVKNCQLPGFPELTKKSPSLSKEKLPESYVLVYIWNPKHDPKPPYRDADYGHAAIKVVHNGETFYFSWFPSGGDYQNEPNIPRATPASYGINKKIDTKEKANKRLNSLFGETLPENSEKQIEQMLKLQSDKEEFRKNATFKIFFTKGINIDKVLNWWKTLLETEQTYDVNSYNCCDVVLHSLQHALDDTINGLSEIQTAKMQKNRNHDVNSILQSHLYETSANTGTKSTTIYQYCYLLAKRINEEYQQRDTISPVIIRYNRWNKSLKKITKFDYDPLNFNPNWMVRPKKISLADTYLNSINLFFSEYVFEEYRNEINEEQVENINKP